MAFREVSVIQVKEVLRRWLRGEGLRSIALGAGVDRKTARRYVEAAGTSGSTVTAARSQLTDELIGRCVRPCVRPARRPRGSWELLAAHEERHQGVGGKGLTVAKIGDLLVRRGVEVPERTLQRFCAERCGAGRRTRQRCGWPTRPGDRAPDRLRPHGARL